jgi:hypothetical protein
MKWYVDSIMHYDGFPGPLSLHTGFIGGSRKFFIGRKAATFTFRMVDSTGSYRMGGGSMPVEVSGPLSRSMSDKEKERMYRAFRKALASPEIVIDRRETEVWRESGKEDNPDYGKIRKIFYSVASPNELRKELKRAYEYAI